MLNRENVEMLIKALRYGEYKQITGRLKRKDNGQDYYCVLGLAAHLSNVGKWVGNSYKVGKCNLQTSIPLPVRDFYGFGCFDCDILMTMNASKGKTFVEIADYLEERLKKPLDI